MGLTPLESCFNGDHSHTWLSKDAGTAAHATIDSTLHQFSGLATEPHVGPGPSPVVAAFFEGDAVAVVRADRVPDHWHHGSTREVYEWAFPRLGFCVAAAGLAFFENRGLRLPSSFVQCTRDSFNARERDHVSVWSLVRQDLRRVGQRGLALLRVVLFRAGQHQVDETLRE